MSLIGHKIEITHANFASMVREHCLLVDKTRMIKDFFEGKKASLILRPHQEVQEQYVSIFKDYLEERLGEVQYDAFIKNLLKGHVEKFTEALGSYLMDSLSYHDVVGKKAEKFYHGFVAGLIASIRSSHWVDSNKESGRGRYDLIIIPKEIHHSRGIIIEFKKTTQADALTAIAEEALHQINTKDYETVLKRYAHDLSTHKKSALVLSKIVDNTDENDW